MFDCSAMGRLWFLGEAITLLMSLGNVWTSTILKEVELSDYEAVVEVATKQRVCDIAAKNLSGELWHLPGCHDLTEIDIVEDALGDLWL